MALPDFLVVGVPKAGTTALHAALVQHPRLFLPAVKEPKFFLSDERYNGPGDRQDFQERFTRWADYEGLFAGAPAGGLRGESTPFYLYDRGAQRAIAHWLPQAKLIAVLRDPIDRAHSNWAHLRAAGLEPIDDFVTACLAEQRRAAAGWGAFWHYLSLSRYGEQLSHLLGLFPREQVLCLRYRELLDQPAAALDRICAFLGVAPGVISTVPAENVTTQPRGSAEQRLARVVLRYGSRIGHRFPPRLRAAGRDPLLSLLRRDHQPRPRLTPEQRRELLPYLADDIARLERVIGRDYSDWLAAGRAAGERGSTPDGRLRQSEEPV